MTRPAADGKVDPTFGGNVNARNFVASLSTDNVLVMVFFMGVMHGAIMPALTRDAKSRGFTLSNKKAGEKILEFMDTVRTTNDIRLID